jgi:hypothetical protein
LSFRCDKRWAVLVATKNCASLNSGGSITSKATDAKRREQQDAEKFRFGVKSRHPSQAADRLGRVDLSSSTVVGDLEP